jgi:hypothetical protein
MVRRVVIEAGKAHALASTPTGGRAIHNDRSVAKQCRRPVRPPARRQSEPSSTAALSSSRPDPPSGRGLADQLADFRDFWPHPGKGTGDTLDDAAIAGAGKAMAK